ncbi:MAG: hypothetical protein RL497_2338 [Pseudomonadota bacterium]
MNLRLVAAGFMCFVAVCYFLRERMLVNAPAINHISSVEQLKPNAEFKKNHLNSSHSANKTDAILTAHAETNNASADNTDIPVPQPLDRVPWAGPERVVLWQNSSPPVIEQRDGVEHLVLQLNPLHLTSLHPGQTLILPLPEGAPEVHALITNTFNDAEGTHNWNAIIQNDVPSASVLITQGKTQTHIAIFTERGSYTLIADNNTGKATLVDEGKLIARQAWVDDGVVLHEHHEIEPPLTP